MEYGESAGTQTELTYQDYLYGGKEFDREYEINAYDFKARFYDITDDRFWSMDPMAEKYYSISPYAYCANNPVRYVDIDGKELVFYKDASSEFKAQVRGTLKYLDKHGAGGLYKSVNKNETDIYIVKGDGESKFLPGKNTIYWDPNIGIETTNGTFLSPATVLNHELDHVNQKLYNSKQKEVDLKTKDSKYGNKEEKRVIEGSEQDTAKKLGEIEKVQKTRTDHEGSFYETKGPTTTDFKLSIEKDILITPKRL
jgi:RHS repeat-associated protein